MKKLFTLVKLLLLAQQLLFAQDTYTVDSLQAILKTVKHDTIKANTLYELSKAYWYTYPDTAIYYATQSLRLSNQIDYKKGIGFATYSMGVSNVWKEDYPKAIEFTKKALKKGEEIGDKHIMASCYVNIGLIYDFQEIYAEALKNYYTALKIAEQIGDKQIISWSYHNMGGVYTQLDNYPQAIKNHFAALKIDMERNDKYGIAGSHSSIGLAYAEQGNYSEALKHQFIALEKWEELKDKNRAAYSYIYIGFAHQQQGNYSEALRNYFTYLKFCEESADTISIGSAYGMIGQALSKQKKYDEAYEYLSKSVKISNESGDLISRRIDYMALAELDSARAGSPLYSIQKRGEYAIKSLEYYKLYISTRDSLSGSENAKKITRLEMQYEFDKKEVASKAEQDKKDVIALEETKQQRTVRNYSFAGIAALILFGGFTYSRYVQRKKLSNQLAQSLVELKQTQGQLIQLEKEKEAEAIRLRISRDIHDDIGSNLTKIAMLGNLASAQSKNKMPEITEQLDKISDYARTVNSSMSEIIWAVNPKQDTLENLLAYMRVHTEEFLKGSGINYKINFPANIPAIQLNPDLKRGLFLVLKESLNNTAKYADSKNISVSFQTFEASFEMQIADDGKGFNLSEINSSKGGNGLQNIKSRMDQSGCSLSIQTSPGNGCIVSVKGLL